MYSREELKREQMRLINAVNVLQKNKLHSGGFYIYVPYYATVNSIDYFVRTERPAQLSSEHLIDFYSVFSSLTVVTGGGALRPCIKRIFASLLIVHVPR